MEVTPLKKDDKEVAYKREKKIIYTNKYFSFVKIGNTFNIFVTKYKSKKPFLSIGPDYSKALIMLFIFFFIGFIINYFVLRMYKNFVVVTSWKLLYFLFIFSFFYTCLATGGVAQEDEIGSNNAKTPVRYCNKCGIRVFQTTVHCLDCDVCVRNFDHHCIVCSKCIGKSNFLSFIMFLVFGGIIYIYSIILVIYFLVVYFK